MLLEQEIRLNFDDVLIRPKRSTLTSRNEVDIERDIKFRNGGWFKGVPILAANMDHIGTFYQLDIPSRIASLSLLLA